MIAMRLISSEKPWTSRSVNARGIRNLDGIDRQAAGVGRLLVLQQRAPEERPAQIGDHQRHRDQEEQVADHVDPVARALGQRAVHDVDADVLVGEQRPRRAQQEHGTEQDPLDLEPRIGRGVEDLADGGVGGTDQHGGQDGPGDEPAHVRVERINGAAEPSSVFNALLPTSGQGLWPRPSLRPRIGYASFS